MAALFLTVEAGMAQSIRSERVSFAPGTSGAVLQGSLNGDQIIDSVLNAQGGQRMVVDMSTSNPRAYFNIQPAGSQQAVQHNASIEGLHYDGLLPSNGDWVVRVYLMGNAARAGRGRVQRAQPDHCTDGNNGNATVVYGSDGQPDRVVYNAGLDGGGTITF
jgi:hypothetical protein